jgi:serine/threonine protein kinase
VVIAQQKGRRLKGNKCPPRRKLLIDFGFLIEFHDSPTTHTLAPEVLNKQGYTTTPDWWSLGVVMYECVFGKVRFFLFIFGISLASPWFPVRPFPGSPRGIKKEGHFADS